MARIGCDVSMRENIESGYLIIEYKVRELMPKGVLDAEATVRFLRHIPAEHREFAVGEKQLALCVDMNANDVYEQYTRKQNDIDSFAGREQPASLPTTPHELLRLADDVDSYCGLEGDRLY